MSGPRCHSRSFDRWQHLLGLVSLEHLDRVGSHDCRRLLCRLVMYVVQISASQTRSHLSKRFPQLFASIEDFIPSFAHWHILVVFQFVMGHIETILKLCLIVLNGLLGRHHVRLFNVRLPSRIKVWLILLCHILLCFFNMRYYYRWHYSYKHLLNF